MVKMLKKIVKGILLGVGTLCVGMLCLGACVSKSSPSVDNTKTVARQVEKEDDIPENIKVTVKKALSYNEMFHMSKEGLRNQLTYDGFEQQEIDEALRYLDDKIDYNEVAVKKAVSYSSSCYMSKQGIFNQLVTQEGFTKEQAQYGIDNAIIDYKENAKRTALNYQQNLNMSKQGIFNQLVNYEHFTQEEAQAGVDNLEW